MFFSDIQRAEAQEVVEYLINNHHLMDYIRDYDYYNSLRYQTIPVVIGNQAYDCVCDGGATRAVFIVKGKDWVIKTDFTVILESDLNEIFPTAASYCDREAELYTYACEEGIEDVFAATEYLCSYGEHTFFIQERVQTTNLTQFCMNKMYYALSNKYPTWSQKKVMDRAKYNVDYMTTDEKIEYAFYSRININTFFNFTVDNFINDLHSQNFGMTERGLVCFDYSGYYTGGDVL